jgi:hypothetical protein
MSGPTASERAGAWLCAFDEALAAGQAEAAAALFVDGGFWRDLSSFTWSIRTMEGRDAIAAMLRATLAHTRPHTHIQKQNISTRSKSAKKTSKQAPKRHPPACLNVHIR